MPSTSGAPASPARASSLADPRSNGSAPPRYDAVIIGSGFGGSLAAHGLVNAGLRVLMLERGDWVERGEHNRDLTGHWNDRPAYSLDTPYQLRGDTRKALGAFHCVGGPSVFYGGVALRLREADFHGHQDITGDLRWSLDYRDLEPYYDTAERLLGVAGELDGDPTAPPRRGSLPITTHEVSPTSHSLAEAARRLGLRPFRLPLALNDREVEGRNRCVACDICDGFACAIEAKNDLATAILPPLIARGLTLHPNAVAVGLVARGGRVTQVECVDRVTGRRFSCEADKVIVAAGALATPHLLLASQLERLNPAGDQVGRNLLRHCNGVVMGASTLRALHPGEFRKQLGIHDFYFGDPRSREPGGKLGAIQQVRATRIALLMAPLPRAVKAALLPILEKMVGFIVIAEDQPHAENRITLDPRRKDVYGMPVAHIHHRHTARDISARRVLADRAAEILMEAGCAFTVRAPIGTFSHGLGTVRMGEDPARFPLDPGGRFRGLENLWVVDGSVFPTSGAVNPSLTISANALRVAQQIAAGDPPVSKPGNGGARPSTETAATPSWLEA